jgi:hypothetical protein
MIRTARCRACGAARIGGAAAGPAWNASSRWWSGRRMPVKLSHSAAARPGALSGAGVHVRAVAGQNRRLERRLGELARRDARVHPFGFTDRIAGLMAACDLVVTLPGALTCGEARAVGRPLMLLDAMPGHGRENLQHELDLGGADVCNPRPGDLTRSVLAALDRRTGAEWLQAFAAALTGLGASPPRRPDPPGEGTPDGGPPVRPVPKEASR